MVLQRIDPISISNSARPTRVPQCVHCIVSVPLASSASILSLNHVHNNNQFDPACSILPSHSTLSTMDPLSVAASVVGLISLANQLAPALLNLGSAVKEAKNDAQAAAAEVTGMCIVLQGLQAYIMGRSRTNPQRLRLITVEHITASLTACVFTYSELDAILRALHTNSGLGVRDHAVWLLKRESIQSLISRIQNHKMTFTCMLNILQW
jgi:hypothetical protein